jgi:leucyl aminopeptidase
LESSRRPLRASLTDAPAARLAVDALAVPVAAGDPLRDAALEIDAALGGLLREVVESGEHRGRPNEVLTLPTTGRLAARRVLLYGLGSPADLDGQRLRFAHHEMVRAARNYGYRRLAVLRTGPLGPDDLGPVVEGCVLGAWVERIKQTGPRTTDLEELQLAGFGAGRERELLAAQQLAEATNRARDWQHLPANFMGPETLARVAGDVAARHGLELEVLGPDELRAGGYNLVLAVGAASAQPPRLIRVQYHGAGGAGGPTLGLVGKGVTFDAGGLSIKPADGMIRQKGDMAGAAVVLSAIDVIAAWRLPIDVMAVVAAAENMVDGQAFRPGDVLTSANGRTIEVQSTDAEGRLLLADGITHAIRQGATHLVDVATLTAGAVIALGHAATFAVSNDDRFWAQVEAASVDAGERVWRMPMYADFRVLLRSRIADLKNSGYGEAGSIAAGMFVAQFVEDRPWAHLDIAGTAANTNRELVTVPRGPLGTGARLAVRLAERMAGTHR